MKKLRAVVLAVSISMFAASNVSPVFADPIPPGGQDRTSQTTTVAPTVPPPIVVEIIVRILLMFF